MASNHRIPTQTGLNAILPKEFIEFHMLHSQKKKKKTTHTQKNPQQNNKDN